MKETAFQSRFKGKILHTSSDGTFLKPGQAKSENPNIYRNGHVVTQSRPPPNSSGRRPAGNSQPVQQQQQQQNTQSNTLNEPRSRLQDQGYRVVQQNRYSNSYTPPNDFSRQPSEYSGNMQKNRVVSAGSYEYTNESQSQYNRPQIQNTQAYRQPSNMQQFESPTSNTWDRMTPYSDTSAQGQQIGMGSNMSSYQNEMNSYSYANHYSQSGNMSSRTQQFTFESKPSSRPGLYDLHREIQAPPSQPQKFVPPNPGYTSQFQPPSQQSQPEPSYQMVSHNNSGGFYSQGSARNYGAMNTMRSLSTGSDNKFAMQKTAEYSNERLVQTSADQLFYSKKHRAVDYTPCTTEEYLKSKPNDYYELGKLQADFENDEYKERKARVDRAKEYAKSVNQSNAETLKQAKRRPLHLEPPKEKTVSARQRAMEFAKTVPRPQAKTEMTEEELPDAGVKYFDDPCSPLFDLTLQHEQQKAEVDQLRRELGLS